MELPNDIHGEIAKYMTPKDLYYMCLVSLEFRDIYRERYFKRTDEYCKKIREHKMKMKICEGYNLELIRVGGYDYNYNYNRKARGYENYGKHMIDRYLEEEFKKIIRDIRFPFYKDKKFFEINDKIKTKRVMLYFNNLILPLTDELVFKIGWRIKLDDLRYLKEGNNLVASLIPNTSVPRYYKLKKEKGLYHLHGIYFYRNEYVSESGKYEQHRYRTITV